MSLWTWPAVKEMLSWCGGIAMIFIFIVALIAIDEGRQGMKILRPGDICPCCGQPIKTQDIIKLLLLSEIAEGRSPTLEELLELGKSPETEEGDAVE